MTDRERLDLCQPCTEANGQHAAEHYQKTRAGKGAQS